MKRIGILVIGILLSQAVFAKEKKTEVKASGESLDQLYQIKGRLMTIVEATQAQLMEINKKIGDPAKESNDPTFIVKGKLITTLEIAQPQLVEINKKIVEKLNESLGSIDEKKN